MKKLLTTGCAALAAGMALADATATVDFGKTVYPIRPALHSAGWSPRSCPRAIQNDDDKVRAMNLTYARTHDWALVNSGQRVCDYQYIFPLFDLDAKNPAYYYFEPTDHLLGLARDVGLKLFYRLGTSIEHTGAIHFNAAVPKDFDKVAEIFAGTVRHYNKGWANGKEWDIKYWEIWNEPDGITNMWCDPEDTRDWGKDAAADAEYDKARRARLRASFVKFFVTCLKRLKSEFGDEIKVGGPALCSYREDYFRDILTACQEAGIAPDFISWHYYGSDPNYLPDTAAAARKLCDGFGFTKCELIVNEWHYILSWDGIHGRNSTPAMVRRAVDGPTGHNNIDSACFTLATLVKIQGSKLDMANYYGCAHQGNWGYMDGYKMPNKNWYALKMFGGLVKDYADVCASSAASDTVTVMPMKSADGRRGAVLVVDYRGTDQVLTVNVPHVAPNAQVTATLLDHTHDGIPVDVRRDGNTFTLVKPDKNSAAYLLNFALDTSMWKVSPGQMLMERAKQRSQP